MAGAQILHCHPPSGIQSMTLSGKQVLLIRAYFCSEENWLSTIMLLHTWWHFMGKWDSSTFFFFPPVFLIAATEVSSEHWRLLTPAAPVERRSHEKKIKLIVLSSFHMWVRAANENRMFPKKDLSSLIQFHIHYWHLGFCVPMVCFSLL